MVDNSDMSEQIPWRVFSVGLKLRHKGRHWRKLP